jgi:hypothetical protein
MLAKVRVRTEAAVQFWTMSKWSLALGWLLIGASLGAFGVAGHSPAWIWLSGAFTALGAVFLGRALAGRRKADAPAAHTRRAGPSGYRG